MCLFVTIYPHFCKILWGVFELELEPSLPQKGELESPVRHKKISLLHEGQLRPAVRHQQISNNWDLLLDTKNQNFLKRIG